LLYNKASFVDIYGY